jgi:hypothetical protein
MSFIFLLIIHNLNFLYLSIFLELSRSNFTSSQNIKKNDFMIKAIIEVYKNVKLWGLIPFSASIGLLWMYSSVSYISSFVATSAFNACIIHIARYPSVISRSPFFSTTVLSFYHKKFSSFLSRLSIHWTSQPTFPSQKRVLWDQILQYHFFFFPLFY